MESCGKILYLTYTIYVEPIKTSNVNLHTLYEFNKITEFSKPEEPLKITKLAPSLKNYDQGRHVFDDGAIYHGSSVLLSCIEQTLEGPLGATGTM